MVKVIERQMENRLVFKKRWMVWQRFASGWRKKKIIDPLKWQRKIRSEK